MMNTSNPLQNKKIEFHILQSFPVSCLNRDDVGSPKTAMVGGVMRARVSSQCWKRAVRMSLQDFGIKLAIRTKKIAEHIATKCLTLGATDEQAKACGEKIASAFSKDTLHFLTESESTAFANYAHEKSFDKEQLNEKELQKLSKKTLNPSVDGLDIALFGRMVAQAADLQIEAASSFAHAISTHKVNNEVEFFTALDDLETQQGSSHLGSLEFNSATYYRYVSLDLGQLSHHLGGQEFLPLAVEAFTKALFVAVPSARQTTQSAASPWEFAKIFVRRGQALQIPFETAIKSMDGFIKPSIDFMQNYLQKQEKLHGSLFKKEREYTYGEDENYTIDRLVEDLKSSVEV